MIWRRKDINAIGHFMILLFALFGSLKIMKILTNFLENFVSQQCARIELSVV